MNPVKCFVFMTQARLSVFEGMLIGSIPTVGTFGWKWFQ
jgi:hypothetical protein